MKPNFEEMSRKELRAYVLKNREDMEALHILFSRRTSDSEATWFHPPKSQEEEQQQFELFKQLVEKIENKKDSPNLEEQESQKEKELETKIRQKIEREVESKLRQKLEKEIESKLRQKLEKEINPD